MQKKIFIFGVLFILFGNIAQNCFASGDAEKDAAFFGAVGGAIGGMIDDAIESNRSQGSSSGGSYSTGGLYYYTISSGYFKADDWSEYCTAGADGYVNNTNSVHLANLGPLPPGTYSITSVQQTLNGSSHANVIVLEMISGDSYGRSNFRIHGGRTDGANGSDGCILMSSGNRQKIASDFYNYGRGTLYVSN